MVIFLSNTKNCHKILNLVGPYDQECFGRGLLHLAVLAPNYHMVKMLLSKGANPNYEDINGATPLCMIFHPIDYRLYKE